MSSQSEKGDDQPKSNSILGGYECNDEYTYIRGRGNSTLIFSSRYFAAFWLFILPIDIFYF